jgi:hypothetical protein
MPADTRGTDFVTWWTNRSAYREDITGKVNQLRGIQSKLAAAAGKAAPANPPATESIAELQEKADKLLKDLAEARVEVPKFAPAIENARKSKDAKIANVKAIATRRITEAEKAKEQAELNVARQALKQKQNMKKLTAVGIAVGILILVVFF